MTVQINYTVASGLRAMAVSNLALFGVLCGAPVAQAQDLCTLLPGGLISCPAPTPGAPLPLAGITLTGSPDPIILTLADGAVVDGPVILGTVGAADIDIVSTGASTIANTTGGPGLVANSGRNITAEVTNVSTVGDGAVAVALTAVDDVVFVSDGTLSTTGANADAINARGQSITLDLTNVSTTGPNAAGVETLALAGPTLVDANVINTSGDGSIGALITGSGDTSLSGNAIRTRGTDAVAFSISNDAAACVVLGAGGCDNTVRLDEVTTDGFGGIGGLVSAVGDTDIDIGVLRTGGDEAAGLDLSADPTACATLGVGSCDTAFTVGSLTTTGDRSPGAIVRAAGDITADVGVLRTSGDEAAGLDLASDPTACAVLGAGACDTSFSVGQLTTSGDGATGVLVRAAGDTTGSVGILSTQGDDAAGIDIASNPAACVIAGVGACDVTLDADQVSTSGDGAAGVLINNAGATTGQFGTILTGGDGSTGLGITQDPTACLAVGPGVCRVTAAADRTETDGDNANAIDIASPGPITLDAGLVDTAGDLSDAIRIAGAEGAISVVADSVNTIGADSDGIDVTSTTGAQTIDAGRVSVAGVGADAIVALAVCADIGITARDDVISARGSAIVARTGCAVAINTLPGASVSGATAGIDVTSGTGATVVIGDTLAATAGPALNVDGAAAVVTIATTGAVNGVINLTDAGDRLINNGAFRPTGVSDFGAGVDLLVNNGRIEVDGVATIAGLEQLTSSGIIDLADGAVGDSLTVSGDFTGVNGQLLVDYGPDGVDRLNVGGAATGATEVIVSPVGPLLVDADGSVVVDGGSVAPGAFTLGGPTSFGLVDVSLGSNATGDVVIFATPNSFALQPVMAGGLVQDFWYQSADAWSAAVAARRDRPEDDGGLWLQAYGGADRRGSSREIDVFGTPTEANFEYETTRYGAQGGFDLGSGKTVFGVTAGFGRAESDLAFGTDAVVDGFNIGAYAITRSDGGLYFEGLAKADFFDLDFENGVLFEGAEIEGVSYGVEGEAGLRRGAGRGQLELGVGLAYVRTNLDGIDLPQGSYAFEDAESLRGRVGARYIQQVDRMTAYGDIKLFHEFMGDNTGSFNSGGFNLPLEDESKGTWVRVEAGLSSAPAGSPGYFLSAWGDVGDVQGYGLRAGIRF